MKNKKPPIAVVFAASETKRNYEEEFDKLLKEAKKEYNPCERCD